MDSIKYLIAKIAGKFALHGVKLGGGMGKSFPGYLFLKIASYNGLKELAKNPKHGSIVITGTNGKTTSTKILINLMENEYKIAASYESNTVNAITTGLLNGNVDFGIFEYGIRDVAHGIPDKIQEVIDPVGVVYTNISREHTQVGGIENKFEDYLHAKSLLSKNMRRGIIISNGSNPYTSHITKNREMEAEENGRDLKVNYFLSALNLETEDKEYSSDPKTLQHHIICEDNLNSNNNIFSISDCGFSKPKPRVEVIEVEANEGRWKFRVSGNPYNYFLKDNFNFDFTCDFPPIGLHNINNALTAITAYASFTSKPEKFEINVKEIFSKIGKGILPPGRFEIFEINKDSSILNQENSKMIKHVGLGQGDNGEALNVNVKFMKMMMKSDNLHFIYTSPDDFEEDIFDDHLKAIKEADPFKVSVLPGRSSIKMAERCYNVIKEIYDSEFYPTVDQDERIGKIYELILSSNMDYVIVSGCGEEQKMWEAIKKLVRKN